MEYQLTREERSLECIQQASDFLKKAKTDRKLSKTEREKLIQHATRLEFFAECIQKYVSP